ncbi:hypothetical protein [Actinomadura nitritigenes]|uniref:hypothetical protein n=1 Tax=Actinomadura nitritigenes TaxID=134602 RepID=UPI003D902C05
MIKKSPPPPDEDVLEVPRSWKRPLHPRRGGHPEPKTAIAGARSRRSGSGLALIPGRSGGALLACWT